MAVVVISGRELDELLASPPGTSAGDLLVVDGRPQAKVGLGAQPWVVVGRDGWDGQGAPLDVVDVVAHDIEPIVATYDASPIASIVLASVLRGSEVRSVADGLVRESLAYSTLQAGPEFTAWRARTPAKERPPSDGPVVRVEREGDGLHIELDRPEVRNALGVQLRDELLEALAVAQADPTLPITLTGAGPSFCSGGDLDEFGSFPDPATAHVIRLARSIGAVLHELRDRTTVRLHGACYGSGVELPAFCGHVRAAADTTLALPELGLGLIPGAGGTVSLPGRIGRHRTAWLALTQQPIDAETALAWGLVDDLVD